MSLTLSPKYLWFCIGCNGGVDGGGADVIRGDEPRGAAVAASASGVVLGGSGLGVGCRVYVRFYRSECNNFFCD